MNDSVPDGVYIGERSYEGVFRADKVVHNGADCFRMIARLDCGFNLFPVFVIISIFWRAPDLFDYSLCYDVFIFSGDKLVFKRRTAAVDHENSLSVSPC